MLRAYAFGFISAALAVVVAALIWFGTQPSDEPALLWGGEVYTTKQEFTSYLAEKGLSYETWLARHPDGAPWEPGRISIGAITIRASTKAREEWVVRLPLLTIALIVASAAALLLLRALRSVSPRLATTPIVFTSAALIVLVVAALWLATQPRREPGLMWGGTVYTTEQEFKGYLKSKGLNYKTWLARNPGAAPWEPNAERAPDEGRGDWAVPSLLAGAGLTVAAGLALLRRRGRLRPRFARGSSGSLRDATILLVGDAAGTSHDGLTGGASRATTSSKVFPLYWERAMHAARAEARRLPEFVRDRNISIGYVVFGFVAATAGVVFAVVVALLLSA